MCLFVAECHRNGDKAHRWRWTRISDRPSSRLGQVGASDTDRILSSKAVPNDRMQSRVGAAARILASDHPSELGLADQKTLEWRCIVDLEVRQHPELFERSLGKILGLIHNQQRTSPLLMKFRRRMTAGEAADHFCPGAGFQARRLQPPCAVDHGPIAKSSPHAPQQSDLRRWSRSGA